MSVRMKFRTHRRVRPGGGAGCGSGARAEMRFEGRVKTWHDERGFGFIAPSDGGPDVFVHIKAFAPGAGRPQVGQTVSFEVETDGRGGRRAGNVAPVGAARASMPARRGAPAQRGAGRARSPVHREPPARAGPPLARRGEAALLAVPALLILYALVALVGRVPDGAPLLHLGASIVTFAVYALDKSAARRGAGRTPESSLHLLSLVGGWPGALLARHFLRHKSAKVPFRRVFWGTVAGNVAVFVLVCSPLGQMYWTG